jgi:flagellar hook-associated protein 2
MAGITTLGIGSSGVLSSDLLDKLKQADTDAQIKPIERNQQEVKLKQDGLRSIKKLLNELADLSTKLADSTHYQATTTKLDGDSISAKVADSVKAQDIKIDVKKLAKNSIKESEKFDSKDSAVGAGVMHLSINGSSYDINISDTDTLDSLSKRIEKETDGKIQGSVLNVGGDKPFRLILKAKESGTANEISATGDIRFYVAQAPKDAEFSVDGATVTSSSNSIKDLMDGVDITLSKKGVTTLHIKEDTQKITDEVSSFVDKYNESIKLISDLTKYDVDKKVGAVFQGSSEIRDVKNRLRDILDTTFSAKGKMANDFGLEIDKKGVLSFDSDKFKGALKSDPEDFHSFFTGTADNKGLFRKFDTTLFELTTKSSGPLKSLQLNLDERSKSLADLLEKSKKSLESRYEILQKKFASFDQVIGTLKNSSDLLNSIIESQYAKK